MLDTYVATRTPPGYINIAFCITRMLAPKTAPAQNKVDQPPNSKIGWKDVFPPTVVPK